MVHDAHGWWIREAGAPPARPELSADESADVVVVGGGYTGLWTAWHAAEAGASVVVLEASRCGFGPSGRNGGFVSSLDLSLPSSDPLAIAARDAVRAIGTWCEEQEVDAWYRAAPHWVVSTAPGQRVPSAVGEHVHSLSSFAACASPAFRDGVSVPCGATVQPARLAFGLRERLVARGVRVYEGTRVAALSSGGGAGQAESASIEGGACDAAVLTARGHRVSAGAVVVAAGAAGSALPPLRDRVTVGSSHIVITEPVPDVIEALGWTGGEAISDARALLHYFRTTPDGRVAFGWAGGRMAAGLRLGGRTEVDPEVVAGAARGMRRVFPMLARTRIEYAWGGPIDVSPSHLPQLHRVDDRTWAAFGYTGNGVGPSYAIGAELAHQALGGAPRFTTPPARRVPPEPLRIAGAALLRRALIAKESIEESCRPAPWPLRAAAELPGRLGVRIVR